MGHIYLPASIRHPPYTPCAGSRKAQHVRDRDPGRSPFYCCSTIQEIHMDTIVRNTRSNPHALPGGGALVLRNATGPWGETGPPGEECGGAHGRSWNIAARTAVKEE